MEELKLIKEGNCYLKPSSCQGCPFERRSKYFTPDKLTNSSIFVLAQNPGESEETGEFLERTFWHQGRQERITTQVDPQPLIGPTGKWIKEDFWPLTGLAKESWDKVSKGNIIKCRPDGKNELPNLKSKELRQAIAHCTRNHLTIPDEAKNILALGVISLYALTGEGVKNEEDDSLNIAKKDRGSSWRGYVIGSEGLDGPHYGITSYYHPVSNARYNIFITLHPASIFKNDKLAHAVKADFYKFGKFLIQEWPVEPPGIKETMPTEIPRIIGFDTEYDPADDNRLIMWSMADLKGNVYVVQAEDSGIITNIPEKTIVVTQNGLVDIVHLSRIIDIRHVTIEDTMIAHSVLWTGEPHDLNYLCSIYGRYNRHKHLAKGNPIFYAGLDADTTLNHVWLGLAKEFKADRQSLAVYKNLRQPLLNIINKYYSHAIAVDHSRVSLISKLLIEKKRQLQEESKVLTNNESFNLGSSQQVSKAIYGR